VITHHRKKGVRQANVQMEDFDVADSQPGPEWHVEQRITTEEVFAACERLPPSQRQVIALRFGAGLSVKDTADSLGKTENNVKVLQHKAIAKLQGMLRP
jgi:RNA polymerase sigma-70 factor (ECF subfamily)